MTKARRTRKPTAAQRRDATDARPPVDRFKRFHFAVGIAPAFTAEYFRSGGPSALGARWRSAEEVADAIVTLADALARRVDREAP
jgi:hypothetical protein